MGSHIKNKSLKDTLPNGSASSHAIVESAVNYEEIVKNMLTQMMRSRKEKDACPRLRIL